MISTTCPICDSELGTRKGCKKDNHTYINFEGKTRHSKERGNCYDGLSIGDFHINTYSSCSVITITIGEFKRYTIDHRLTHTEIKEYAKMYLLI